MITRNAIRRLAACLALLATTDAGAQTCPVGTAAPPLSQTRPGRISSTLAGDFDLLVRSWVSDPRVVQSVSCPRGICLWVPWYVVSHSCSVPELKRECNPASPSLDDNCLVTDEFSQVGLVLAMWNDASRFEQWMNTVEVLAGGTNGQLPVWLARRAGSTYQPSTQDDASDANARIITALYVGAANSRFPEALRSRARAKATALLRDFVRFNFVTSCRSGRHGDRRICAWLASGSDAARGGLASHDFTYAGYYGDVVIALLAGYAATGDSTLIGLARDTVEAYLLAARFQSGGFSVPYVRFRWNAAVDPPAPVCTHTCEPATWDDSDAVRAVTICKAAYYARLAGADLGTDLTAYCQAWMASGGVQRDAYSIQYTADGAPLGVRPGYYENGLGASLNFFLCPEDLATKLYEALGHYTPATRTFDSTSCMGVYRPAFLFVNLGSAIGYDLGAFSSVQPKRGRRRAVRH